MSRCIGQHDNNVAEYAALLDALQYAVDLKAKALHVFSRFVGITIPLQEKAYSKSVAKSFTKAAYLLKTKMLVRFHRS